MLFLSTYSVKVVPFLRYVVSIQYFAKRGMTAVYVDDVWGYLGSINPLSRMIFLRIENMKDCVHTRI